MPDSDDEPAYVPAPGGIRRYLAEKRALAARVWEYVRNYANNDEIDGISDRARAART
ncbi:hypothetical protein GCM10022222_14000 [Amycolatopsis ultiminotia]|uniref:Uncharacterized protein n=1 Tax=Amycolatopsis ultiminotia TaxID=543629 RepID=A0ABP6VEC3_9PSEU